MVKGQNFAVDVLVQVLHNSSGDSMPKIQNHKSVESLNHDGLGFFQWKNFEDCLFAEIKSVKKGGKTGKIFHKLYCYNYTKYRISTLEEILRCFFDLSF